MKKIKLTKHYFHPITTYLILSLVIIIASVILHLFGLKTTYDIININTLKVQQITSNVVNLLNFTIVKDLVSNALKNFISFAPLSMYLVASIGIAVCDASGFLDVLFKKIFSKINNYWMTFIIIFFSTISSLINEIGFVIMIPIAAIMYKSKKRNPLAGIIAAFAGTAFGYGTSIFVGSIDDIMIPYTSISSRLVDPVFHISLTSNLFIMIISSIVLTIVGTYVTENKIIPRLGANRERNEETGELEVIDDFDRQIILSKDYKEKRGFKWAVIVGSLYIIFMIWSLIPHLPLSGLLLDLKEETYLNMLFGENAYFQDGFTFLIAMFFLIVGIAYGVGSKKFVSDKDFISSTSSSLKNVGYMLGLFFAASQFITLFRTSNIGNVFIGYMSNLLNSISNIGGLPYLLICIVVFILSDFLVTGVETKWAVFAPTVIPLLMKSSIAPQFVQFAMRICDSLTNGINPLYAFFVIYVGYMNIYNNSKRAITIKESIKMIMPYFWVVLITWLFLLIGWYIIGLPIGPRVYPTL